MHIEHIKLSEEVMRTDYSDSPYADPIRNAPGDPVSVLVRLSFDALLFEKQYRDEAASDK